MDQSGVMRARGEAAARVAPARAKPAHNRWDFFSLDGFLGRFSKK
jgi:hypothetical protein